MRAKVRLMPALAAFDLDGVLYSSEPFLGEAYREAIERVNARRPGSFERVPATREILDHIGWPVLIILERLFPGAEEAAMRLLHAETLAVICAHVARGDGLLYPGVAPTLGALRADGLHLAVASNGRTQYVETVLETYALGDLFVGCDYGHGYRHEIEAAGPLVSRFADLPAAIAAALAAAG